MFCRRYSVLDLRGMYTWPEDRLSCNGTDMRVLYTDLTRLPEYLLS